MPDYHALYLRLMGAQTDAIEALVKTSSMLVKVHREMEEKVMDAPELNLTVLPRSEEDKKDE